MQKEAVVGLLRGYIRMKKATGIGHMGRKHSHI